MSRIQDVNPWLKATERARFIAPCVNTSLGEFEINTGEWTHLCSCRFGEARPSGQGSVVLWTGDAYRYDIYHHPRYRGRESVAIRWQNGAGCGWLICRVEPQCSELNLIENIVTNPNENARWDYCHFLYEMVDANRRAARIDEYRELTQAFVDGRLKKRKQRGQNGYKVTIDPAMPVTQVTIDA